MQYPTKEHLNNQTRSAKNSRSPSPSQLLLNRMHYENDINESTINEKFEVKSTPDKPNCVLKQDCTISTNKLEITKIRDGLECLKCQLKFANMGYVLQHVRQHHKDSRTVCVNGSVGTHKTIQKKKRGRPPNKQRKLRKATENILVIDKKPTFSSKNTNISTIPTEKDTKLCQKSNIGVGSFTHKFCQDDGVAFLEGARYCVECGRQRK